MACKTRRETFQEIGEASTDGSFHQLRNSHLEKGGHIVEYSSKIMKLVGELESAGHSLSEIDKRHALLFGLSSSYDATVKAVMKGLSDTVRLFPSSLFTEHLLTTNKRYLSEHLRRRLR